MRRVCVLLPLVLGMVLMPTGLARASAYTKVLQTYERRGNVPACQFSSAELSSALKGVDTYGAQYFADFTNAIRSALAARASGQCAPGASSQPARIPPAARNLRSPDLGGVTASTHAGIPAPILLMALLSASGVLVVALLGLASLRGWEPAPVAAWRHAWSEAGYRLGGSWAEFRDWLRSA